jgi:hypothetical protein
VLLLLELLMMHCPYCPYSPGYSLTLPGFVRYLAGLSQSRLQQLLQLQLLVLAAVHTGCTRDALQWSESLLSVPSLLCGTCSSQCQLLLLLMPQRALSGDRQQPCCLTSNLKRCCCCRHRQNAAKKMQSSHY